MIHSELVDRCRNNDRNAQMSLYRHYCDGMFCVANRYVKDSMEAEDIVQESFIKAFKKLHQYREEVSFGAWLKRIVINKSIDTLKARKAKLMELNEVHLKVVDEPADENWMVDDSVAVEEIKAAIEDLPDKYKYVVILYLLEGYDHQEIAEILEISEVASRTQLSRGKRKLKTKLNHLKDGTRY